jgi:hypothetical protein
MPEPYLAENEFFRSGNSLLKTLIPDAIPLGFALPLSIHLLFQLKLGVHCEWQERRNNLIHAVQQSSIRLYDGSARAAPSRRSKPLYKGC